MGRIRRGHQWVRGWRRAGADAGGEACGADGIGADVGDEVEV